MPMHALETLKVNIFSIILSSRCDGHWRENRTEVHVDERNLDGEVSLRSVPVRAPSPKHDAILSVRASFPGFGDVHRRVPLHDCFQDHGLARQN